MPRTASEQTEDWVENYFVKQCTTAGAITIKNQRRRGWPDRTVYWWHGVSDLVETKRPKGGQFEPLQLRTIAKLQRMGHRVYVLNTRAQVDAYIIERAAFARPKRKIGVSHA